MSLPGAEVVRLDDPLEDAVGAYNGFHGAEDRGPGRRRQIERANTGHERTYCEALCLLQLRMEAETTAWLGAQAVPEMRRAGLGAMPTECWCSTSKWELPRSRPR